MRVFCAKGSAPPVIAAARAYRGRSRREVEVAVCGQSCARGQCAPGSTAHGFVPEVAAASFDVAIGGSEADVDDLEQAGMVREGSRRSLGLREAAILVPAGNPAGVRGLLDLARPGLRIGISTIDCLRGVWEDVCGRAGCIHQVSPNISARVTGCMAIIRAVTVGEVDAAFGWSSFAYGNPRVACVRLPPAYRIYRATAAAVLQDAVDPAGAASFAPGPKINPLGSPQPLRR